MRRLFLWFILIILAAGTQTSRLSAQLPDVCQAAENIMANCTFDQGLDHWQTFIETGGANFSVLQGGGECHAPLCPAAYIMTEGHFVGGLYQQVPVQAGNSYYANIIWLVFDSLSNDAGVNGRVGGIGRRIGIDPSGGTDPQSPNVVWGVDNWRNDCKICGVEEVSVTAQADVITVFLRIDDTWRVRAADKGYAIPPSKDQFWIDDIGLKQVDGSQVVPTSAPTETAVPPTDAPPPPPPTNTPQVESVSETIALAEIPTPAEVALEAEAISEATSEPTEETLSESQPEEVIEAEQVSAPEPTSLAELPTIESTVAAPPTITPTYTPQPTEAAVALKALPTIETVPLELEPAALSSQVASPLSFELLGAAGGLVCLGSILVVVMGVALLGVSWLYRLGWGNPEAEFEDDTTTLNSEIFE
jgi:hypothetical protein